jgi:hypothetical protein
MTVNLYIDGMLADYETFDHEYLGTIARTLMINSFRARLKVINSKDLNKCDNWQIILSIKSKMNLLKLEE